MSLSRRRAPKAPTVHRIPGIHAAPALREFPTIGRKLQGGLPPEPYRTPWARAGLTGRSAREPFNCKEIKGEFYATRKYLA